MSLEAINLDLVGLVFTMLAYVLTSAPASVIAYKINQNYGRLIQGGLLIILYMFTGIPFVGALGILNLVIGIGDYIASTNSEFDWLDPSLAGGQ